MAEAENPKKLSPEQKKEVHNQVAMELRRECRYWEAQCHLKQAIDIAKELADASKNFESKYNGYKEITEYRKITQNLDCNFDFNNFKTDGGTLVETVVVSRDEDNDNFRNMYEKYSSDDVKEIIIYERNIWKIDQLHCMKVLTMVLRDQCPNLQFVMLKYAKNTLPATKLDGFKEDVEKYGVKFVHEPAIYSKDDDHKVVFSSGYVFCFPKQFDLIKYFSKIDSNEYKIEVWKPDVKSF